MGGVGAEDLEGGVRCGRALERASIPSERISNVFVSTNVDD